MRSFIFPGQGSQKVGMGAELADASAAAREVFQEVDDALGQKLFAIMREGPDDQLTRTENAQPAIMANAMATLRVLEKDFGKHELVVGALAHDREELLPERFVDFLEYLARRGAGIGQLGPHADLLAALAREDECSHLNLRSC